MAGGAQANNLIVNGGFETGDYTGWSSTGCGPAGVSGNFAGWLPHSGNFFSYEGGVGCDHVLSQTFSDTPGQTATISFWYGSDGATPNDLHVYWDSNLIYTLIDEPDTQPNYNLYTFTELTTGSDTLAIGILNDPAYQALDDVSVSTAVPEPASLLMLAAGIAALGVGLRRR